MSYITTQPIPSTNEYGHEDIEIETIEKVVIDGSNCPVEDGNKWVRLGVDGTPFQTAHLGLVDGVDNYSVNANGDGSVIFYNQSLYSIIPISGKNFKYIEYEFDIVSTNEGGITYPEAAASIPSVLAGTGSGSVMVYTDIFNVDGQNIRCLAWNHPAQTANIITPVLEFETKVVARFYITEFIVSKIEVVYGNTAHTITPPQSMQVQDKAYFHTLPNKTLHSVYAYGDGIVGGLCTGLTGTKTYEWRKIDYREGDTHLEDTPIDEEIIDGDDTISGTKTVITDPESGELTITDSVTGEVTTVDPITGKITGGDEVVIFDTDKKKVIIRVTPYGGYLLSFFGFYCIVNGEEVSDVVTIAGVYEYGVDLTASIREGSGVLRVEFSSSIAIL